MRGAGATTGSTLMSGLDDLYILYFTYQGEHMTQMDEAMSMIHLDIEHFS
jgi:hypothetical protein